MQQVTKRYGAFTALDGASFQTSDDARVVALLGPSGGGKSTMLRVLGGLLLPESGAVLVDDQPLPNDPAAALQTLRRNGFVFQGYNLFPHLSALQNIVSLPLRVVHGLLASMKPPRVRWSCYATRPGRASAQAPR